MRRAVAFSVVFSVFSPLIALAPAHGQSYQVAATSVQMSLITQVTGTDNGSAVNCGAGDDVVPELSPPTVAYAVTGSAATLATFSLMGTGSVNTWTQCALPGGDVAQLSLTGGNVSVGVPAATWQIDPFSTAWLCQGLYGAPGLLSQSNPDGTFPGELESFDYSVSLGTTVIASGSVSRTIDVQFHLFPICPTAGALYAPPLALQLAGLYADTTVDYTVGHFTGQIGPHNLDLTIQVRVGHTESFDVPPPPTTTTTSTTTTTTTQPPSTGTTWRLTVKERETCCAGGRCEGDSGGFSSSLVLESDGTYRASQETCPTTGGALPDSVGEVRPLSRRRFALLTPTNLDEIAEAFRECQGYDSLVLRAFRNRLKIAKDGLSLRGTLSYAGRYSQSGTVVACRVSGSYRGTLSK